MRGISLSFGMIFLLALAASTPANADAKHDAALCKSVASGTAASIARLLKKGADVNANCDGDTPLMDAVQYGNDAVIKALLEGKADVTRRDKDGWTALYWARSVHAADLLVRHGADVNAGDHENNTPLMAATMVASLPLVQLLLDHNADVSARLDNGNNALGIAINLQDAVSAALEPARVPSARAIEALLRAHGATPP